MINETFDFGYALCLLKAGLHVRRLGWGEERKWLVLHRPDNQSKIRPYICMKTAQGDLEPWLSGQADILSNDWQIVKHEEGAAAA